MNEKLKQLQARLFDIGAYGKNATRAAEVDGKMGGRTREAIKQALKRGYYVDLNKGTVTNIRIGGSTSQSSSSNFGPRYGQISNDPTNVPGYNPIFGGRLAPGQGYGLPEVTVTANPRGYSARAQQTRTTINGKTVQQVKQKRKSDAQMQSIEGNLDFATARGQQHDVTEQERVPAPNVAWSGPAQNLAQRAVNGVLQRDVTYTIPQQHRAVLSDQNQWILDNWSQAFSHNLAIARQRLQETQNRFNAAKTTEEREKLAKELESNRQSINNIQNNWEQVRGAGGLYNWLLANPNQKMVIGANMRLYKDANQSRFPASTPTAYANFNAPNYIGYAQNTPLGQVENVYGNTVQSFTYNPQTNRIVTRVSDTYDFNPYGSSSEDSEVKKLRTSAGNSETLRRGTTAYADTLTSIPIDDRRGSQRYLTTDQFGESSGEDSWLQRGLATLGIKFFENH